MSGLMVSKYNTNEINQKFKTIFHGSILMLHVVILKLQSPNQLLRCLKEKKKRNVFTHLGKTSFK